MGGPGGTPPFRKTPHEALHMCVQYVSFASRPNVHLLLLIFLCESFTATHHARAYLLLFSFRGGNLVFVYSFMLSFVLCAPYIGYCYYKVRVYNMAFTVTTLSLGVLSLVEQKTRKKYRMQYKLPRIGNFLVPFPCVCLNMAPSYLLV